jgi:CheY-like chemotaxis protein
MVSTGHSEPRPDGPGLRARVVEDDPDLVAAMARWPGRCGYQARLAPDGPTALRAATTSPPDVVLLDLGLPGMDGLKVAQRVHAEVAAAAPKAPLVIAVAGRGTEDDHRHSASAGIDLRLSKPVDAGLLLRALRRFQGIVA